MSRGRLPHKMGYALSVKAGFRQGYIDYDDVIKAFHDRRFS